MATSKLQRFTGNLLDETFPQFKIRENYRPEWMISSNYTKLELDFFIEEINLGIEVQGIQHYVFSSFFYKSVEDFDKRKLYDQEKKDLCYGRGIKLVEIFSEMDIILFIKDLKDELWLKNQIKNKNIITKSEPNIVNIKYTDIKYPQYYYRSYSEHIDHPIKIEHEHDSELYRDYHSRIKFKQQDLGSKDGWRKLQSKFLYEAYIASGNSKKETEKKIEFLTKEASEILIFAGANNCDESVLKWILKHEESSDEMTEKIQKSMKRITSLDASKDKQYRSIGGIQWILKKENLLYDKFIIKQVLYAIYGDQYKEKII